MKENTIINVTWDNLVVHKIDRFPYGVITQYYICDECMYLHIIDAESCDYAVRARVNFNDITSIKDLVQEIYANFYGKITVNVCVDYIHPSKAKSAFQLELEDAIEKIYYLKVFSSWAIQIASQSIPIEDDAMELYYECKGYFSSKYDYITDYLRPYAALLTPKAISVALATMPDGLRDHSRIVARFVDICKGAIDESLLMEPSLDLKEINILFRRGIYTVKDWREYESRCKL